MVQVGDKIGNYQVVRSLGSGAMGTVYEAQHLSLIHIYSAAETMPGG